MRQLLKVVANFFATMVVAPEIVSFRLRSWLIGRDRALQGSTQTLGLLPGLVGQYLRRAFLRHALEYCDHTATVEFGTIFSKAGARLETNVYIGPRCHVGLAHIERDTLIAAGVHIPSGAHSHGTANAVEPIREQIGEVRLMRIGRGTWIGSAAVVMADVGCNCVIGAGAVVTAAIPDFTVAVGVPAKPVRSRRETAAPHPAYCLTQRSAT